jgi:glutathione synthase/RimK-type ligase-like ATP-grasp enzyme
MKQFLKIRTKNHSAQPLKNLIETPVRAVFRLGSLTPTEEVFPRGVALNKPIIEINTAEACHNSGNKILMKSCFDQHEVKSAVYDLLDDVPHLWDVYPAIIKHKNSCKGQGIYYIENEDDFIEFVSTHGDLRPYIIEKYYNYSKEYRLHVTKDGCFYACRKMLKEDAEERWHRHDMNSVWIMEENPLFEKPSNWDLIVEESVKAMKSLGLDICSVDMKVQSEKNKDRGGNPEFIILECNSASSMGERTLIEYEKILRKIVNEY